MKKIIFTVVLVMLLGLLISCATSPPPPQPSGEKIGTVQTRFIIRPGIFALAQQQAPMHLLEEAKKQYSGVVEIGNIQVTFVRMISGRMGAQNSEAEYMATGDVFQTSSGGNRNTATGVEGALARAAEEISENFTARSRIAIVYITAEDRGQTDYIAGELEHILRRRGFVIIDRSELDRIRAEQRFGVSGEVDDNTAARIGNIAGASVVITGRVDGEGNLRRLRLRALDTTSGQVIGTASERL